MSEFSRHVWVFLSCRCVHQRFTVSVKFDIFYFAGCFFAAKCQYCIIPGVTLEPVAQVQPISTTPCFFQFSTL